MRLGGASKRSLSNIMLTSQEDLLALRRSGVGGWGALAVKNLSKLPQFCGIAARQPQLAVFAIYPSRAQHAALRAGGAARSIGCEIDSHVGIREFRAALAESIDADRPVTEKRHGQAVALFLPLHRHSALDVQRVQTAAAEFRKATLLSEDEVEEWIADFDALRHGSPLPSRKVG